MVVFLGEAEEVVVDFLGEAEEVVVDFLGEGCSFTTGAGRSSGLVAFLQGFSTGMAGIVVLFVFFFANAAGVVMIDGYRSARFFGALPQYMESWGSRDLPLWHVRRWKAKHQAKMYVSSSVSSLYSSTKLGLSGSQQTQTQETRATLTQHHHLGRTRYFHQT